MLLLIDVNKVVAEIKYENLVGGEKQFPHIYGELNDDAVARVYAFEQNESGKFEFPSELLKDLEP